MQIRTTEATTEQPYKTVGPKNPAELSLPHEDVQKCDDLRCQDGGLITHGFLHEYAVNEFAEYRILSPQPLDVLCRAGAGGWLGANPPQGNRPDASGESSAVISVCGRVVVAMTLSEQC